MGQAPGGEGFEPDMQLGGDGHLHRVHERIADHADVAARRGPVRGQRLAVEEAPAVGAGGGPEVAQVRPAHFRARLVYPTPPAARNAWGWRCA